MKTNTRITVYRDPYGDRHWIVATDAGDASEETVIAQKSSRSAALKIAKRRAAAEKLPLVEG